MRGNRHVLTAAGARTLLVDTFEKEEEARVTVRAQKRLGILEPGMHVRTRK